MALISTIKAGLKTRLETISELQVWDFIPGSITPPAAVIQFDSCDYDATMGRGSDDFLFTVMIMVSAGDLESSQDALDLYIDGSGSKSVKAAIEGGVISGIHFAVVQRAQNYGMTEFANGEFPSVDFLVRVTA